MIKAWMKTYKYEVCHALIAVLQNAILQISIKV